MEDDQVLEFLEEQLNDLGDVEGNFVLVKPAAATERQWQWALDVCGVEAA